MVQESYSIEDDGSQLSLLNDYFESVAILQYYPDYKNSCLVVPWAESYEEGKGYMSKLYKKAIQIAKSEGLESVLAEVDDDNDRMREILEHWGFKECNRQVISYLETARSYMIKYLGKESENY